MVARASEGANRLLACEESPQSFDSHSLSGTAANRSMNTRLDVCRELLTGSHVMTQASPCGSASLCQNRSNLGSKGVLWPPPPV